MTEKPRNKVLLKKTHPGSLGQKTEVVVWKCSPHDPIPSRLKQPVLLLVSCRLGPEERDIDNVEEARLAAILVLALES